MSEELISEYLRINKLFRLGVSRLKDDFRVQRTNGVLNGWGFYKEQLDSLWATMTPEEQEEMRRRTDAWIDAECHRESRVREEIIRITQKYASTTFATNTFVDEITDLVLRGDTHNGNDQSNTAPGDTPSPQ